MHRPTVEDVDERPDGGQKDAQQQRVECRVARDLGLLRGRKEHREDLRGLDVVFGGSRNVSHLAVHLRQVGYHHLPLADALQQVLERRRHLLSQGFN